MSNEAEDEGPPESLSENLDNENDNVALKETSSEDASRKESSKQKSEFPYKVACSKVNNCVPFIRHNQAVNLLEIKHLAGDIQVFLTRVVRSGSFESLF